MEGWDVIYSLMVLAGFFGFCLGILITMLFRHSVDISRRRRKRIKQTLCEDCYPVYIAGDYENS